MIKARDDSVDAAVRSWAVHLGVDAVDVAPDELRTTLRAGSLSAAFREAAEAHPDATVQIGERSQTHAALHRQAASAGAVLAAAGVGRGNTVGIRASSSIDFLICYLGALHIGAAVVLINPAYTHSEVEHTLERSRAALLISEQPDSDLDVREIPLHQLISAVETTDPTEAAALGPDDVALLAFTSGTTSRPKGVPLSHGSLLASIRGIIAAWRWSSEDVLVHALPLFHQHGLSGVHATLLSGSSLVVLPRFDPEDLVEAVERHRGTVLFGVPSIHERLMSLPREQLEPLRAMRLITSGSAPLSTKLAAAFEAKVGMLPLERYGLTESGLDVSNPYAGKRVPGSVGFPLPGVEISLRTSDGDPAPGGEQGEICMRGPQIFTGYLDNDEANAAAFWPGDWFRTGDLGQWDHDGRLSITGRLKELIISGGMNVASLEVERVLEGHERVKEAAVTGIPSERWGEEVAAWVVARDGATADGSELIEHCRAQLASYKCPKRVFVVPELPHNAMGKLVRARLHPPA